MSFIIVLPNLQSLHLLLSNCTKCIWLYCTTQPIIICKILWIFLCKCMILFIHCCPKLWPWMTEPSMNPTSRLQKTLSAFYNWSRTFIFLITTDADRDKPSSAVPLSYAKRFRVFQLIVLFGGALSTPSESVFDDLGMRLSNQPQFTETPRCVPNTAQY